MNDLDEHLTQTRTYLYDCGPCERRGVEVAMTVEERMGDRPGCPDCGAPMFPHIFPAATFSGEKAKEKFDKMYPYVSSRLPRNIPGVPCTRSGKPIILSKSHEREVAAQTQRRRD